MNVINLVTVFLVINIFEHSSSFQWISLKSGDAMPPYAIRLDSNFNKYVGRTEYLNTLQLAEIHKDTNANNMDNITHAVLILYSNEIVRHNFQVLVATEPCEWIWYDKTNVPENIVRGGTAWDFEPVFIAKRQTSYDVGIASIYLTSDKIQSSPKYSEGYTYALICDEHHTWVDATSTSVPEKSVEVGAGKFPLIGISYVARLLGPVSYVPGNVAPEFNRTIVNYKGFKLQSFNIQVLVEESQEYRWRTTMKGNGIPEYAVVCGVSENNGLMYIGKNSDNEVFPIYFSDTREINSFEILVTNVN